MYRMYFEIVFAKQGRIGEGQGFALEGRGVGAFAGSGHVQDPRQATFSLRLVLGFVG